MSEIDLLQTLREEWGTLTAHTPRAALRRAPPTAVVLFAELEDVRLAWEDIGASLVLPRVAERFINTQWAVRDLLAHLASWAREFRYEVETVLQGGGFDYAIPFALSVIGPNEWNAREVEERHDAALTELFAEIDGETRRLQDLTLRASPDALAGTSAFPLAPSGNPDEKWRGAPGQIVLMKCMHDRYHLAQIERFLSKIES